MECYSPKGKQQPELVCGLMFDEMAIKKHIQWDEERFHGYVDIGTECEDDTNPVATEALLVFMIVPLNSHWKLPVGYFTQSRNIRM